MAKPMTKRYSVYDRRTEQPLIINGTAAECAKRLGMGLESFWVLVSRAHTGRGWQSKKYEIFDDEEDDIDEMDLH